MKTFLIAWLSGVIVGACGLWGLQEYRAGTLATAREHATEILDAKLHLLGLQSAEIERELAETGQVVRHRASAFGEHVADAASDVRITGAIKAKLATDPDLSALDVSVSTTDGVVTLSGRVASSRLVGKAVLLALETSGVREVVAVLRISRG